MNLLGVFHWEKTKTKSFEQHNNQNPKTPKPQNPVQKRICIWVFARFLKGERITLSNRCMLDIVSISGLFKACIEVWFPSEFGKVFRWHCISFSISLIAFFVVLLLEMLVRAELAEECKEHMQWLDHWLTILQLMYWDVTHCADNLRVISHMHIDFGAWEGSWLHGLLHLWVPLLH